MMKKKGRVILLIYHGQGHFNACLRIAELLSQEYETYFAGHIYFQKYVISQGFHFYPLTTVPFGLGFETWLNQQEGKKNIWWQNIKDRWTDRLCDLREASLIKMLNDISPSHVIIDSWQSTDFIVLYERLRQQKIKTAFVQTMLSTIVSSQPPLTSNLLPDEKYSPEKQLRHFIWAKWRKRTLDWFRFLGMDDDSMISRRVRKNKIPPGYLSPSHAIFTPTFNNIPEFILAPIEFEFSGFTPKPHQYYVGSLLADLRKESESQQFQITFSEIIAQLPKRQLVYCTFGSTDLEEIDDVLHFLKKLIAIVQSENLCCIISSANERIIKGLGRSNDIYIFPSVPQLKVLQYASLFITHGGLNSIKEAIHFEIPILAFPVRTRTDNPGNAARIEYHGLGVRGNLKTETVDEIKLKMQKLLSNKGYKENLRKFKLNTNYYSDERFLKLFQAIDEVK